MIAIQHGKERGRMMSSRIRHTINTHGRRKTSPALTYIDIDANQIQTSTVHRTRHPSPVTKLHQGSMRSVLSPLTTPGLATFLLASSASCPDAKTGGGSVRGSDGQELP